MVAAIEGTNITVLSIKWLKNGIRLWMKEEAAKITEAAELEQFLKDHEKLILPKDKKSEPTT